MGYAEEGHKTIAIDFDGTIHSGTYPDFLPPNDGIKEGIKALKADGWKILIYTARICNWWYKGMQEPDRYKEYDRTKQDIGDYCRKWGIPFDKIWMGEGKPYASCYVDDKAVSYYPGMDLVTAVNKKYVGECPDCEGEGDNIAGLLGELPVYKDCKTCGGTGIKYGFYKKWDD